MDCPRCGYAIDAFDVDCPRCKRMAKASQSPAAKPEQPAPWQVTSGTPPPIAPPQQQHAPGAEYPPARSGAGGRTNASAAFGVLLIVCVCFVVGWFIDGFLSGGSPIRKLDRQQISVRAHLDSYSVSDFLWTGTVVVDEGPLSGSKLVGAGIADPLTPIGVGSHVRLTGTVKVRARGFLRGYDVEISPMVLMPE